MTSPAPPGSPVRLANERWEVLIEPASLRVVAHLPGRVEIELSAAQPGLGRVRDLAQVGSQAGWALLDSGTEVTFRLDGGTLAVEITSHAPGSFTWPVIAPQAGAAYVLPLAEGNYVPTDDKRWLEYLVQRSPMKALESFSMPFWGVMLRDYSVTYLLTNQFNNQVSFSDHAGQIGLSLIHEFTPNRELKQYGLLVRLGEASPVEPARQCRSWLIEQGQFVSMKAKIERTPEAAKLLGAPHIYLWQDGRSVSTVEQLAALGCGPMRIGLSSAQWGFERPELVRAVKELGGLIFPYDSYHSIHHPDQADSWDTAQFDLELYEKGPIQNLVGAKLPGYLGRGYQLSPLAVWPYVKQRVSRIMSELPEQFNAWFVDCDAYGEVFDDYSPLHPATQEDDVKARLQRMAWIRDEYGLPIGSEGGVAYSAGTIHFAEGMMTPVFGWGDADLMKDTSSPYHLGTWGSQGSPTILLKRVPLKPYYRTFHFDPAFRLPLYQTVFHDSVVTTHHWHHSSLKFTDQVQTVELLELLYNVPPLYHLNSAELAEHGSRIAAHNAFFAPLHRELGLLPMTDFAWLTDDRMVQSTVFGDEVELVANFSNRPFDDSTAAIPARNVLARRLGTGATTVYTPAPSPPDHQP
ncbi:MAG: glycoside hydrolase [Armatimonadota bacterium]